MYRIIFLLLLMATIMPLLLEVYAKCYEGHGPSADDYTETTCPDQDEDEVECHSLKCNDDPERVGCGSCPQLESDRPGCNCTSCKENLCNLPEDVPKCYEASSESADLKVSFCRSVGCFLVQCSVTSGSGSHMGCGACPNPGSLAPGCKCTTECKENLCNQPLVPIKQCFGEGRSTPSGGFEYKPVECHWFNNDGCKTIERNGGRRAEDYEKSCGKCPAEKEQFSQGEKCKECTGELCNEKNEDKVVVSLAIKPFVTIVGM